MGSMRSPSISWSTTTGCPDFSSFVRPATRTGIMPTLLAALPSAVRGRSRVALALVPRRRRVVALQRGSGLLHVVEHPLRGLDQVRLRMVADEVVERGARGR